MRVIPMKELMTAKGIAYSRAHLYRLIWEGKFPTPISLSDTRIAFVDDEIDHWLESKVSDRDCRKSSSDLDNDNNDDD